MAAHRKTIYEAYGRGLESELPLPFPEAAPGTELVGAIRLLDRAPAAPAGRDGPLRYSVGNPSWELAWDGEAHYRIGEQEIGVATLGGELPAITARLSGQVLGLFLRRKGDLVLHANVVARRGEAVALVGPTGAGKTTVTRALLDAGYSFMSDDLCVARRAGDGWYVFGGPAALKVRSGDGKVIQKVEPGLRKARLQRIVVLRAQAPVAMARANGAGALLELVRHAHVPRSLDETGLAGQHFDQCGALCRSVPLYVLDRGDGPRDLAAACMNIESLESDVRS